MSIDDRDYMKNRGNGNDSPYYNPKEFRGSKEHFYRDPWLQRLLRRKKKIGNTTEDVSWHTTAFGIPLYKLLSSIVVVAVCLALLNKGYFDSLLNKRQNYSNATQQGLVQAPVNFNPQPAPVPTPAVQATEIAAASVTSSGAYSIPRSGNGHFYISGSVNNTPAVFLVDTGASMAVISSNMAVRAGITQCTKQEFMTAMGIDRDACVARVARLQFGTFYMDNIEVGISKNLTGEALLGMSVLRNLRMTQIGDKLLLEKPN